MWRDICCGEECAAVDGYREEVITHEDGSKEEIRSCNFCRGDDFGDKELLEFVTSAIGVSRDDLVNFYKRYKTELKNDKACRLNGFISSVFTNKDSGTGKGFVLGGLVGRFESIHE
jgi:hypothetical protein